MLEFNVDSFPKKYLHFTSISSVFDPDIQHYQG